MYKITNYKRVRESWETIICSELLDQSVVTTSEPREVGLGRYEVSLFFSLKNNPDIRIPHAVIVLASTNKKELEELLQIIIQRLNDKIIDFPATLISE